MAVIFHVKGTAVNAVVSQAGKVPAQIGTITVDSGSGTGIIGDSIINLDQGNSLQNNVLIYPGRGNTPSTKEMSVLIRCAFGTTGNVQRLWNMANSKNPTDILGSGQYLNPGGSSLLWFSNQFFNYMNDETGVNIPGLNGVAAGAFTPTIGRYYDLVLTYEGVTANWKFFIDGVLEYTLAPARFWPDVKNQ